MNVEWNRVFPASMGPPPFGGGNLIRQCDITEKVGPASMGPPPFGGGNLPQLGFGHAPEYGLQWGLRLSAVEIMAVLESPEGAVSALQWGLRLSAVEIRLPGKPAHRQQERRFNGASAFRRWKFVGFIPECSGPGWIASMGPPPFGGGNGRHSSQPLIAGSSSRFNGASAFRRWKCRVLVAEPPDVVDSFNGASAFRRWKFGTTSRPPQPRGTCFNGASAFRRWKY